MARRPSPTAGWRGATRGHRAPAVRQQWGELTHDDVDQMQGNAEQLIGKLQERYGQTREQAEQELDRWLREQGRPEGQRARKAS